MNILFAMFGSNAAAEICFGLLVFLLLYVAGFVLFQRWSRISRQMPVFHRHLVPGLGAALAATWVGIWLHAGNVGTAAAEGQAGAAIPMSPQELQRSVTPMPVQTFEDQSVVYPGRE